MPPARAWLRPLSRVGSAGAPQVAARSAVVVMSVSGRVVGVGVEVP